MEITTLSHPSWKSQLRALFVIARKDWKVFWRYPLNAVSHVFQPLIWVTPVYFMGKAFSTNGQAMGFAAYTGSGDYMSYILIGTALSNFIMTVDVMVVVNRLVSVRPTRICRREIGVSQFDSSTPASMSSLRA